MLFSLRTSPCSMKVQLRQVFCWEQGWGSVQKLQNEIYPKVVVLIKNRFYNSLLKSSALDGRVTLRYAQRLNAQHVFNGNIGLQISDISGYINAYCISSLNLGNRYLHVGCTPGDCEAGTTPGPLRYSKKIDREAFRQDSKIPEDIIDLCNPLNTPGVCFLVVGCNWIRPIWIQKDLQNFKITQSVEFSDPRFRFSFGLVVEASGKLPGCNFEKTVANLTYWVIIKLCSSTSTISA